jgi:hypothetical protein
VSSVLQGTLVTVLGVTHVAQGVKNVNHPHSVPNVSTQVYRYRGMVRAYVCWGLT